MAKTTRRRAGAGSGSSGPAASPRDAAVDALMALLADRSFGEIGLGDVAERAGMSLADLRGLFDGKLAMLGAFGARIDKAVLDGGAAEGESGRDRLFDVLMRRFEAMAPYRAGLKSLVRSARGEPALACALAMLAERSMGWMLAAAQSGAGGIIGRVKRTGAAMVFGEAMRVWLDDDDPGLARTMATLDKALARGERVLGRLEDARTFFCSFRRGRDRQGDNVGDTAGEAAG